MGGKLLPRIFQYLRGTFQYPSGSFQYLPGSFQYHPVIFQYLPGGFQYRSGGFQCRPGDFQYFLLSHFPCLCRDSPTTVAFSITFLAIFMMKQPTC